MSLLTIKYGVFKAKATAGDTHFGGEYFDNRTVDYFLADFKYRHCKDLSKNQCALCHLCTACKRTLSSSKQAQIVINSLFLGY